MSLTPAQVAAFESNGFLILPSVLSPEEVEFYTHEGDSLIDSSEVMFRDREDGADGFRCLFEQSTSFCPLIAHRRVLKAVVQLLGSHNIHLSSSHLSYLYPRSDRSTWTSYWHSDIYGVEDDLGEDMVRLGIKVGYFLSSHQQPETGMTLFVPGSNHLRAPLHIPPGQQNPIGAFEPQANTGDCILFENRTRHSVGINLSRDTRKSIFVGYTYRWVIPLEQFFDEDSVSAHLDEVGRELLPRPYRTGESPRLRELHRSAQAS